MIFSTGIKEALIRLKRTQKNITVIYTGKHAPEKMPGIEIIHLPYKSENPDSRQGGTGRE
jgi:hypothetical protein